MWKPRILTGFFYLLLILFISRSLLRSGFPFTHDGENHLARFANYKVAVREGQLPPRFAPNLMNHYGYPVFNYNYPLANLLSLPFSLAKVSYEVTFKIIVFGFLLGAAIGVEKWLTLLGFSLKVRRFTLLVLAASPYLISAIVFRGNIGEVMAIALLPWLFWSIEKIPALQKSSQFQWCISLGVWAAFFLSHNVSVLFGTPLLFLYALCVFGFQKKPWLRFLPSFFLAILLTLWFWLPAVVEKSLVVVGDANLSQSFTQHFVTLEQLFFSPLRFGFSFLGSIDSTSFAVGILQMVVLLVGSLFSLQKKWSKKMSCLLVMNWLLLLFQLGWTTSVWRLIPLANFIQFPWRLSLFFTILILPIVAQVLHQVPRKGQFLLVILLCWQLFAFSRVKPVDYFHKDNLTYENFPQSTSTANENLPTEFRYEQISDWLPAPKTLVGQAEFKVITWNGSYRQYEADVTQLSTIVEPTMDFAGWETTVQDFTRNVTFPLSHLKEKEVAGRIAFQLQPGKYKITTGFTQNTWPRRLGNATAIFTMLGIAAYLFISKLKKQDVNA